jgi:hypothetical protein
VEKPSFRRPKTYTEADFGWLANCA